eukprot:429601-Pleurochrysis_carterae.AAC.2
MQGRRRRDIQVALAGKDVCDDWCRAFQLVDSAVKNAAKVRARHVSPRAKFFYAGRCAQERPSLFPLKAAQHRRRQKAN